MKSRFRKNTGSIIKNAVRVFACLLVMFVLLNNLQNSFSLSLENNSNSPNKKFQQSEEVMLQEVENSESSEADCECEDSEFTNYEKQHPVALKLFSKLVGIEKEKTFSDFSLSPASPPPDSFIS